MTEHQSCISIQNKERLKGLIIFSGFIVWVVLLSITHNANLVLAVPLVLACAVLGSMKMVFGRLFQYLD